MEPNPTQPQAYIEQPRALSGVKIAALLVGGALVGAVLALAGYQQYSRSASTPIATTTPAAVTPTVTTSDEDAVLFSLIRPFVDGSVSYLRPGNYQAKTFADKTLGVQFSYPSSWSSKGEGMTFAFGAFRPRPQDDLGNDTAVLIYVEKIPGDIDAAVKVLSNEGILEDEPGAKKITFQNQEVLIHRNSGPRQYELHMYVPVSGVHILFNLNATAEDIPGITLVLSTLKLSSITSTNP
jgi:hypothetical protein